MTEATASCGRCSRTIDDTPIGVSVDGGPLHSTFDRPSPPICPECAASMARWLERGRHRAASSPGVHLVLPLRRAPAAGRNAHAHRMKQYR